MKAYWGSEATAPRFALHGGEWSVSRHGVSLVSGVKVKGKGKGKVITVLFLTEHRTMKSY
jgi:hypothetical protein